MNGRTEWPTLVIAERTAVTMTTSSLCLWRIAVFLDEEVCTGMVAMMEENVITNNFIPRNHMLSAISVADDLITAGEIGVTFVDFSLTRSLFNIHALTGRDYDYVKRFRGGREKVL